MCDWSTYVQPPDFLEATRRMMLDMDILPVIIKWIGIKPGMRILDVGCGTGAFSYYLAQGTDNCEFVGIDTDKTYIKLAQQKNDNNNGSNRFEFLLDDALNIPYEKESFDIIVSHTFLTNMKKPVLALREMMRVGKAGGIIASITAQSIENIPLHPGFYPVTHSDYFMEWAQLTQKVWKMYNTIRPVKDYLFDTAPQLIPRAFVEAGLWNICMHGIGKGFSLSNAAIDDNDKRFYIEACRKAEQAKFKAFSELEGFHDIITPEEEKRYKELVDIRSEALMKEVGENVIWEWTGGANILMTGVIPPSIRTLLNFRKKQDE